MAQRRKIALIYSYNENWIGGTYYIQNLISALNKLPGNSRFELVIFSENDSQLSDLRNITKYPFIAKGTFVLKLPLLKRVINRIGRVALNKNIFSVLNKDIDLVFPGANEGCFKKNQQFLYWIPDFQEHYLQEFFTTKEIEARKTSQAEIIQKGKYIVFSSRSAKNDFNEIYPSNNLTQFILPFAVTHPKFKSNNSIIGKYKLPNRFFICCNQFWKHKNHIVVIKAIHLLKKQGHEVFVAFTGKEDDYRHPDFFGELTKMVETLGIKNNVRFLGFINREDQLCLMKNAVAVIQPSLFEGWSTVIEDAKALKIKIIASNINVHQEQLEQYGFSALFPPDNEHELAASVLAIDKIAAIVPDYEKNIIAFAENFKVIFEAISND